MEKGKYYVMYGPAPKKVEDPDLSYANYINKPYGRKVQWVCRVFRKQIHYSWLDWCVSEGFHLDIYRPETRKVFKLRDDANILVLNGMSGIKKLFDNENLLVHHNPASIFNELTLNWDYILAHYDGVELIHGDAWSKYHMSSFNSWDVDSLVVWKPGILQPISSYMLPRWARRNINKMEKSSLRYYKSEAEKFD